MQYSRSTTKLQLCVKPLLNSRGSTTLIGLSLVAVLGIVVVLALAASIGSKVENDLSALEHEVTSAADGVPGAPGGGGSETPAGGDSESGASSSAGAPEAPGTELESPEAEDLEGSETPSGGGGCASGLDPNGKPCVVHGNNK